MNKQELIEKLQAQIEREENNRICHLLMIPFTGLGSNKGFRGDEWFERRVNIFKENTLKSILNQTNQNYIIWITFRPEEATNPITQRLWNDLQGLKLPVIFTFGGIPFWDDKYNRTEAKGLLKRLKDILADENGLKSVIGKSQYVYETILASDDMYHKDVVESIQQQPFAYKRALVHWNGYIRETETGRLGEWKPPVGHLPPFYTIMYPADVFMDAKKHFDYLKGYKSHEDIEKLFDCVRLPDSRYMVNVHGNNISTCWMGYKHDALEKTQHDFIGEEITDEKERVEILKSFGIICQDQKCPVSLQPQAEQP